MVLSKKLRFSYNINICVYIHYRNQGTELSAKLGHVHIFNRTRIKFSFLKRKLSNVEMLKMKFQPLRCCDVSKLVTIVLKDSIYCQCFVCAKNVEYLALCSFGKKIAAKLQKTEMILDTAG
jgi:hypothetical protein